MNAHFSSLSDECAYRHTTRSERTTREAHKDNLIAWFIIRCDETISLPNILSQVVRYLFSASL